MPTISNWTKCRPLISRMTDLIANRRTILWYGGLFGYRNGGTGNPSPTMLRSLWGILHSVVLSEGEESTHWQSAFQIFGAQILRLLFVPLRMTHPRRRLGNGLPRAARRPRNDKEITMRRGRAITDRPYGF